MRVASWIIFAMLILSAVVGIVFAYWGAMAGVPVGTWLPTVMISAVNVLIAYLILDLLRRAR